MQLRRYKERVADGRDSADEDARAASSAPAAWPSLPGDRGFELELKKQLLLKKPG